MKNDFENVKENIVLLSKDEKVRIINLLVNDLFKNELKYEYVLVLARLLSMAFEIEIDNEVLLNTVNVFENFTEENKKLVVNKLIMSIISLENKNSCDLKDRECLKEGHLFSKWREVNYQTSNICGEIDGSYLKTTNHRYWTRICTRCHCYERTDENPFEKNTSKSEVLTKVKK